MPAVEHEPRRAPQQLKPRRPAHLRQTRAHGRVRDAPAARAQRRHRLERDGRVAQLVRPQQRQRIFRAAVGEGLPVHAVGQRHDGGCVRLRERDAPLRADLVQDGAHLRRLRIADGARAGLEDARLLARDLLERIAEDLRVVEADVRDDGARRRGNDVRRVEPAAEADLQHHDVAPPPPEPQHGRRRHELKLRRRVVHGGDARLQRLAHGGKLRVRHGHAVDLHALGEALEIRRCEQPRRVACRAQDGCEHRRRAALAVRARDVHELQPVLRVAQAVQQLAHAREPRAGAAPLHAMDQLHGLLNCHIAAPPAQKIRCCDYTTFRAARQPGYLRFCAAWGKLLF